MSLAVGLDDLPAFVLVRLGGGWGVGVAAGVFG